MIPETSIRSEKFYGANSYLKELLNEVPLTRDQRDRAERLISDMEIVFEEANQ